MEEDCPDSPVMEPELHCTNALQILVWWDFFFPLENSDDVNTNQKDTWHFLPLFFLLPSVAHSVTLPTGEEVEAGSWTRRKG